MFIQSSVLCNFLWQWMRANTMKLFTSCVFAACLIKVVSEVLILITFTCGMHTKFEWLTLKITIHTGIQTVVRILQNVCGKSSCFKYWFNYASLLLYWQNLRSLTLILRRSRTGTVWFYTSTSNKRAARPKLYTVVNKGLKTYV